MSITDICIVLLLTWNSSQELSCLSNTSLPKGDRQAQVWVPSSLELFLCQGKRSLGFPEDELIHYKINQCCLTVDWTKRDSQFLPYVLPDFVWLILPPKQKTSRQLSTKSHCPAISAREIIHCGKLCLPNRTGNFLLQKVLQFYPLLSQNE